MHFRDTNSLRKLGSYIDVGKEFWKMCTWTFICFFDLKQPSFGDPLIPVDISAWNTGSLYSWNSFLRLLRNLVIKRMPIWALQVIHLYVHISGFMWHVDTQKRCVPPQATTASGRWRAYIP